MIKSALSKKMLSSRNIIGSLKLATRSLQSLVPKHLVTNEEVLSAKRLLYECYVDEMGWTPCPDNPTGFRIQEEQGQNVLVDNYDEGAQWFGVVNMEDSNKVVSVVRSAPRNEKGKFDFNLYEDTQAAKTKEFLAQLNASQSPLLQISRAATSFDFRSRGLLWAATLKNLEYAYQTNNGVIMVNPRNSVYRMLCKSGIKDVDVDFDYGDGLLHRVLISTNNQLPDFIESLKANANVQLETDPVSDSREGALRKVSC